MWRSQWVHFDSHPITSCERTQSQQKSEICQLFRPYLGPASHLRISWMSHWKVVRRLADELRYESFSNNTAILSPVFNNSWVQAVEILSRVLILFVDPAGCLPNSRCKRWPLRKLELISTKAGLSRPEPFSEEILLQCTWLLWSRRRKGLLAISWYSSYKKYIDPSRSLIVCHVMLSLST